uniref:Uncharacterized protein n=1 Tax=Arundo donax TaxID=35708 RepID=A0A0A9FVN2_ARUDO
MPISESIFTSFGQPPSLLHWSRLLAFSSSPHQLSSRLLPATENFISICEKNSSAVFYFFLKVSLQSLHGLEPHHRICNKDTKDKTLGSHPDGK